MSWRTAIEINHDQLHYLEENPTWFRNLVQYLISGDFEDVSHLPGITYLGTRHHSDERDYHVK